MQKILKDSCLQKVKIKCKCGIEMETVKYGNTDINDVDILCDSCHRMWLIEQDKERKQKNINKYRNVMLNVFGERFKNASFDNIDYNKIDNIVISVFKQAEKAVRNLFIDDKYIITLVGKSGNGKTFLAACAVWDCLINQRSFKYIRAKTFLNEYKIMFYSNNPKEYNIIKHEIFKMKNFDLLIIDEIDKIKASVEDMSILMDILDYRYNNYKPVILIGNMNAGVKDFEAIFGNALTDRILAKGNVLKYLDAESIRRK